MTVGTTLLVSASWLLGSTGAAAAAPGEELQPLFAISTSCGEKTYEWSGSNSTVNGSVHSNDQVKFGGTNTVNGLGTCVDTVHDASKIAVVAPTVIDAGLSGPGGRPAPMVDGRPSPLGLICLAAGIAMSIGGCIRPRRGHQA